MSKAVVVAVGGVRLHVLSIKYGDIGTPYEAPASERDVTRLRGNAATRVLHGGPRYRTVADGKNGGSK